MALDPLTAGLDLGKSLIERWFPNKEEAAKREAELYAMMAQGDFEEFKQRVSVLIAEAQSEHKLTSQWRPITMLTFVVIIANNYIIAPYMNALFGVSVSLEIPPDMWDLLKLGLGGYVAGRSVEKGIKLWKKPETS